MTTITVGDDYIEVKGHSYYAESGKDIVCSAISTLSEATYNYLKCTKNKVNFEESDGYYKILFPKLNKAGEAIKMEFIRMVDEISKDYPRNVRRKK